MIEASDYLTLDDPHVDYLLGSSDAEHERLIRQARRLAPVTESFFREAGIGRGQRVLDVGSGVGDVAMLLSRLVGPSGAVVAVERDPRSIARAKARAAEARLYNVTFVLTDITQFSSDASFDAAVGRFILQFLPDPVGILRFLSDKVTSGGIIAFQECCWGPFALLSAHLPLWSTAVSLLHEVSARLGVNTEMGPALYRVFRDAGLPGPRMRLEMELGQDSDFTRWVSDVVTSVRPQIEKFNISCETLGDLDTLQQRLHEEVAASNTVVPWLAMVGAWCHKPMN